MYSNKKGKEGENGVVYDHNMSIVQKLSILCILLLVDLVMETCTFNIY